MRHRSNCIIINVTSRKRNRRGGADVRPGRSARLAGLVRLELFLLRPRHHLRSATRSRVYAVDSGSWSTVSKATPTQPHRQSLVGLSPHATAAGYGSSPGGRRSWRDRWGGDPVVSVDNGRKWSRRGGLDGVCRLSLLRGPGVARETTNRSVGADSPPTAKAVQIGAERRLSSAAPRSRAVRPRHGGLGHGQGSQVVDRCERVRMPLPSRRRVPAPSEQERLGLGEVAVSLAEDGQIVDR